MRQTYAGVLAALTLLAALGTVASPATRGATASVPSDFNGDGYSDLAIGVPGQDLGDIVDAGQVNVIYGSATGLTAAGDQVWTQGSPGIKGVPEDNGAAFPYPGDHFGEFLASGDFDGDGYADLAIASPYDRVSGPLEGAVNVIYGAATGLNERGDQLFSRANVPGTSGLGFGLESGDFDGDGYADLATYAGVEQATDDGWDTDNGGVIVLRGTESGLTPIGSTALWLGALGLPADPGRSSRINGALSAGDADGDGADELAIGIALVTVGGKEDVGAVAVVPGGADGPDATRAAMFSGDSTGVPGEAEPFDHFGSVLEFGDFTGDGNDDLAVGSREKNEARGAVWILLGGASGVSSTGSQLWTQDTPGVPGAGEPADRFGWSLVAADFDVDGRADLAVATPAEGFAGVIRAGVVTVLRGASVGLTATGAQLWSQNSDGVPGAAERSDHFGETLAAGNFGRSARPDLAVGLPREDAGDKRATGIANVLYARTGGLSGSGAQSWWLDSPGIKGIAQAASLWGSALAAR